MSAPLKITLAQCNPIVGDIAGNKEKIIETWNVWDDQSDLIVFPELFLSGYPPEDLVLNTVFMDTINNAIKDIMKRTKTNKSAALLPSPWTDGHRIFNTVMLIEKGEITAIQHKVKLPNYYVFDEPRTFWAGDMPTPVTFKGHKLGILICEDMWHKDVPEHLAKEGAEIFIVINGSPYHYTKHETRLSLARNIAQTLGLGSVYLNMYGGQDELVFDGRSFIMHPNGQLVFVAEDFEEEIINFSMQLNHKKKPIFSILHGNDYKDKALNILEDLYHAVTMGLRDYVYKNGFQDVLIGLSGGIDSALSAAIAADAVGAEHVRCVMLPSEFTSESSLNDAKECAETIGISYDVIPIKEAVKAFEKTIPGLTGIAHENTQSRIRGTILMALSNISGAMLVTTGNKSEMAVGYATLYGDMNGGYNPLKDLYKTEVYQLAAWRNTLSKVIPQQILTKAPSAELRPDQKDEDSLPPYNLLDNILRCLIEFDNIDWHEANDVMLDIRKNALKHPEDIKRIAQLLKNSEYKRFQSPPGPRISPRAFGKDRRYPLSNHFVNDVEKD